jgi:hypothetical protein
MVNRRGEGGDASELSSRLASEQDFALRAEPDMSAQIAHVVSSYTVVQR